MARKKTPTFTVEFPLDTSPADDRELRVRREAYRQINNAVLCESLKNLKRMRESKAFRAACELPKGSNKNADGRAKKKLRSETFETLNEKYNFTIGHMYSFAALCCKQAPHIGDHTESHGVQTTALRAFEAVQDYAFGKKGKPKFKGYKELNSVEGKQDCCLIIRAEGDKRLVVKWNGLTMPLILDLKNDWKIQALTEYPTKFIRVVWKEIKGKTRTYVQIAKEGISPHREQHKIGTGVVGIDMGPSTVAIVGESAAILTDICPTIEVPTKEIRRIQRKMDRSIRASNPDAFNENGTRKKGVRTKVKSKTYEKDRSKKADIERCLAAERKRSHGGLVNQVLSIGNDIKTEDVSVKAWQRSWYGKSTGKSAPAAFMALAGRRAVESGGTYTRFSTYKTKLSQIDHTTGVYTKKPLSQREHIFPDGTKVQRDLYSAFLARFVEDHKLDVSQCVEHWAGVESLLRIAALSYTKGARGKVSINPTLLPINLGTTSETPATKISIGPSCPKEAQSKIADVVGAVAEMQHATRAAKSVRLQNARLAKETKSDEESHSTVKVEWRDSLDSPIFHESEFTRQFSGSCSLSDMLSIFETSLAQLLQLLHGHVVILASGCQESLSDLSCSFFGGKQGQLNQPCIESCTCLNIGVTCHQAVAATLR